MLTVRLPENCSAETISPVWRETRDAVARLRAGDTLVLDADSVRQCGGPGEALILDLFCRSKKQGFAITPRDASRVIERTLRLFNAAAFTDTPATAAIPVQRLRTCEQVGEAAVRIYRDICEQLAFLGEVVSALGSLVYAPRRLRARDTALCFERAGIDALPITLLIGFLLGLILAFLSAASLRQFGVEVYVADMIAIGLFRELGPLITAIILAGRTGSAFAAELGTMKVNEELDALTTFGIPPVRFLALPRVTAATLVMPFLTIFAVLAGLLGGLVVLIGMRIPAVTYWQHVIHSSSLGNMLLGLIKSLAFGLLVGLVGCSHGLQTERTADGVGRAATAAVVGSLVLIALFDGLFAVLFYVLGV